MVQVLVVVLLDCSGGASFPCQLVSEPLQFIQPLHVNRPTTTSLQAQRCRLLCLRLLPWPPPRRRAVPLDAPAPLPRYVATRAGVTGGFCQMFFFLVFLPTLHTRFGGATSGAFPCTWLVDADARRVLIPSRESCRIIAKTAVAPPGCAAFSKHTPRPVNVGAKKEK